jgi:hypothetical protein
MYRYEHSWAGALKLRQLGRDDGSLGFAVLVGSGRTAGFCFRGSDAALLVPGTGLACYSA